MENQLLTRKILSEKWIEPSRFNEDGAMFWYNKYGDLHSVNDKPAIINGIKNKWWCKNGKRHRDGDKPAIILLNKSKYWYKNGLLHRDGDKPAIIWLNGSKSWYKNGKYIKANF